MGTTYELHFLTNAQDDDADVTITVGNDNINFAGVFHFADGAS